MNQNSLKAIVLHLLARSSLPLVGMIFNVVQDLSLSCYPRNHSARRPTPHENQQPLVVTVESCGNPVFSRCNVFALQLESSYYT